MFLGEVINNDFYVSLQENATMKLQRKVNRMTENITSIIQKWKKVDFG